MDKFLIFIDALDDAVMYPISSLQGMNVSSNATLRLVFSPGSLGTGQAASADVVELAITADKELEVFKALAKKIADIGSFSGSNSLVVCDDVSSVFAHSDILSCTISIDS